MLPQSKNIIGERNHRMLSAETETYEDNHFEPSESDPDDLTVGERQQKYFIEPNGMLHNGYPDEKCYCGHLTSQHLDCTDCCLDAQCICESFENGVASPQEQNGKEKWKKKNGKVQTEEDQQLISYIKTLSEM